MQNTKALSIAYGVSPNLVSETEGFLYPPYYSSLDLQNKLGQCDAFRRDGYAERPAWPLCDNGKHRLFTQRARTQTFLCR